MLTVLTANGPSGYSIANSLRFRSSASAYLNRTPASAGNRQTWTWSAWVKRGALGVQQFLFDGRSTASQNPHTWISFLATDALLVGTYDTADTIQLTTSQVFRDPSAWYHIVCVLDTTQATAANRVKLFINGAQVTAFSTATYPPQNFQAYINAAQAHSIGAGVAGAAGTLFDGYMAEVNFIDGQALTPSSFGEIDSITGVWKPKQYAGTYGTNGFKLNFSNGTSTTTLGYDSSGNGNNWTTNNISLTAGSTYDWMIDSPTPFAGSSYGVGNYAVLNPLWKDSGTSITNGNLNVAGGNFGGVSTISMPTGSKFYCEATVTATQGNQFVGILQVGGLNGNINYLNFGGSYAYSYYSTSGNKSVLGTLSAYGSSWGTIGDVIGIAADLTANTVTFYKNNVSQGAISIASGIDYLFGASNASITGGVAFNFGQRPFAFSPPTGFKSLCTQNLPAPSIVNGASYMAATTYTGTGASLSVSGAAFQPDLVWIKSRSAATDHALYDVIRGTQNRLESNTTDAAVATDAGLTAFGASGFTVNTLAQVNTNTATYIGWQWKAGGTAVTNTAGSITSQVSANTTAGFSVVTYTGTLSAAGSATFGHGLGVAPSMIIAKGRNASGGGWPTYHVSVGLNKFLELNNSNAQANDTQGWQSVSSSIITVGQDICQSGSNWVAYCFAAIPGYSAFGSYTGNGSSDGPFVYCGFRPRYVLVKATSSAEHWFTWDTSRDPYNVASNDLYPNLSNAESAAPPRLDFLSNGFKCRASAANPNLNGVTYIYAAFAENPFQNALAR